MNRILLFGAGGYYRDHRSIIKNLPNTEVVGFLDNNADKQGTELDGYPVYLPEQTEEISYDFIVLTSIYACTMEKQLQKQGIGENRIFRLREYQGLCERDIVKHYAAKHTGGAGADEKSVLLITSDLETNGGYSAARYTLRALKAAGYRVGMAAAFGRETCVDELCRDGIEVFLYPNIEFSSYETCGFLQTYDVIIVNTYQMYHCIYWIAEHKPLVWWIHESSDMYENDEKIWGKPDARFLKQARICAVSKRARETFRNFLPDLPAEILEYGIPDKSCAAEVSHSCRVFAVIGNVCDIKGQDLFLEAAGQLGEDGSECEFWVIGRLFDTEYCRKLQSRAKNWENVLLTGEVEHRELEELYERIDVVVVPSRMDSLPIVATEALMYRKPLILSSAVGTRQYLPEGAATIFPAENAEELQKCMLAMIRGEVVTDTENGRLVYDRFFSMEALQRRWIKILGEMENGKAVQ